MTKKDWRRLRNISAGLLAALLAAFTAYMWLRTR